MKLNKENLKLQAENNQLMEQNMRLSKKMIKKPHAILSTPKHRNKDYSKSHARRLKMQRTQNCKDALLFLGQTEYTPIALKVKSKTGLMETLILDDGAKKEDQKVQKQAQDTNLNMLLYAKEKFNMSNEAYHEMSMIFDKSLPRSHILKKKVKDLNNSFNIKPMEGSVEGFEQSIKEVLPQIILGHLENENFTVPEVIRVKMSGDGTWLGSKLHVINFTFTLPDFPDAKASSGNTLLAIFKSTESYDNLKIALRNIVSECKDYSHATVNDKIYPLQFYLGGDLKFLNLVCGIDSNSSKYSCLWCTCPADQRYDMTKEWSMADSNKGARTVAGISKCAVLKSKENRNLIAVIPQYLNLFH